MSSYLRRALNSFSITRKLFSKKQKTKHPTLDDLHKLFEESELKKESVEDIITNSTRLICGVKAFEVLSSLEGYVPNSKADNSRIKGYFKGCAVIQDMMLNDDQVITVSKNMDEPNSGSTAWGPIIDTLSFSDTWDLLPSRADLNSNTKETRKKYSGVSKSASKILKPIGTLLLLIIGLLVCLVIFTTISEYGGV